MSFGAFSPVEIPKILPGAPGPPVDASVLHEEQAAMVRSLILQKDTSVFRLLMSAQTAGEFDALRKEIFQKYISLSVAVANIIKADLAGQDLDYLLNTAYAAFQRTIESDTVLFAGLEQLRSEVLYSVDILLRAHSLLCQIVESLACGVSVDESVQQRDAELIWRSLGYLWYSLMHLEAILYAIRNGLIPSVEVLRELVTWLGISEQAYESVRESWGFRFDNTYNDVDLPALKPDAESAHLVSESDKEYKHYLEVNPTERP